MGWWVGGWVGQSISGQLAREKSVAPAASVAA